MSFASSVPAFILHQPCNVASNSLNTYGRKGPAVNTTANHMIALTCTQVIALTAPGGISAHGQPCNCKTSPTFRQP